MAAGIYISYQGDAMPCCMVSNPDRINFGNMGEQGVSKVWSSEHFQHFRDQLDSDEPPELCCPCAVYNGTF
jgi:radical SAM protein with 4Fe4S-binding SPASM domain